MIKELLNKGRQALSIGDWEEARRLLEEALKIEESAEIFEELAWACWWLNDATAVFKYREKAYNLFLDKNDKRGASRTASWLGVDYLEFKGEYAIANGWFQRAENLLEGFEITPELGLVKILKARLSFSVDNNSELALKLAEESLVISKTLNNAEGEILAEAIKGFIFVTEGNVTEGMSLLDEATLLALSEETTDINIITITCCFLIDACERVRDYERAGQWCIKVKEICERWKHKVMFATCRTQYATVLIWRGDWKEAEEELLAALSEFKKFRPIEINSSLVRLADLKRRQGKWDEANKLFNEIKSHRLKPLGCAAFSFDRGDYEIAADMAERFLRQFPSVKMVEKIPGLELLLRIYVKLGKLEQAESVLSELKEIAEAINTPPIKAASLSAEGILNYAYENYKLAKENLEDAIDIYDKIISPFELSRTRLVLAEVLIRLNQNSRAESELSTALKTFQKLGAEKDFEKAKYLLKNLYKDNALLIDPNRYKFTARELELLRLIAEGKNNEEIAEKLFLSVRTVEKHLTNIYQKLGISGKSARAFAASYAIKNNLIPA